MFVTASHCTEFFDFSEAGPGEVPVNFDPVIGTNPTIFWGTHHTNPEFGFSGPGGNRTLTMLPLSYLRRRFLA